MLLFGKTKKDGNYEKDLFASGDDVVLFLLQRKAGENRIIKTFFVTHFSVLDRSRNGEPAKRAWYWYRNEYAHIAPPEWPSEGEAAQLKIEASKMRKLKADGTDDAWLLVKVCDSKGMELSNSPTVRLEIISGPGSFPTGKSITFSPDSPVFITDGKAAITVRSYSRGRTVIRATADGLKPATVKLKWKASNTL